MNRIPISREQIFAFIADNRDRIRAFGVLRLGLFGSAARGESRADSDLDFVVDLETKSFDAYMDLKFFLEDGLGRPVDLVLLDSIKPRLRAEILAETALASGF